MFFVNLGILGNSVRLSSVLFLLRNLTLIVLLLALTRNSVRLNAPVIIGRSGYERSNGTQLLTVLFRATRFTLNRGRLTITTDLVVKGETVRVEQSVRALCPGFALVRVTMTVCRKYLATASQLSLNANGCSADNMDVGRRMLRQYLLITCLCQALLTRFLVFLIRGPGALVLCGDSRIFSVLVGVRDRLTNPFLLILRRFVVRVVGLEMFLVRYRRILITRVPLSIFVVALVRRVAFLSGL